LENNKVKLNNELIEMIEETIGYLDLNGKMFNLEMLDES